MVLELIKDDLNGDYWEKIISDCYEQHFKGRSNIQDVPTFQGDGGIEGYTEHGIVWQCYCPKDLNLSNTDLYEKLREKLTTDIKKIYQPENIEFYKKIGVPIIQEWHFVIPEYRDNRILVHAENKRKEVLKAIETNNLTHISKDFKIWIKGAKSFKSEISQLFIEKSMKLNFKLDDIPIDYKNCSSEKKDNIERKFTSFESNKRKRSILINSSIENYLKYIGFKNNLLGISQFREKFLSNIESLKQSTLTILALADNFKLSYKEQSLRIEHILSNDFPQFSLSECSHISQMILSTWIADCNMDFLLEDE